MEIKITLFGIVMFLGYTAWTMLAILVGGVIVENFLDRLRWKRWEKEREKEMLERVADIKRREEAREKQRAEEDKRYIVGLLGEDPTEQEDKQ